MTHTSAHTPARTPAHTSAAASASPDTSLLDLLLQAGADPASVTGGSADPGPRDEPDPDPSGGFERAWAGTPISTRSPDGQISLTVTGDADPRFGFAAGYLQRAPRQQVARQVERLLRLSFAVRTRRYLELRSALAGRPVRPGRPAPASADRAYAEGLAGLAVSGRSDDGRVAISVLGMREFRVSLAPGALALGDAGLAGALAQAGARLLADQAGQVWHLQDRLFFGGA